MSPLLAQIASLTERLQMTEAREQALQERLRYNKSQLEATFETTQDQRRRLNDQTQRLLLDPLTKVYNRAAFNDRLELEYRRWVHSQKSAPSLCLMSITSKQSTTTMAIRPETRHLRSLHEPSASGYQSWKLWPDSAAKSLSY